jgi:hypothetical protein
MFRPTQPSSTEIKFGVTALPSVTMIGDFVFITLLNEVSVVPLSMPHESSFLVG